MLFLYDSFTDANGTLVVNHDPDVGGAWTNLGYDHLGNSRSALTIQNNRATNRSNLYVNQAVPPSNEYEIVAPFQVPASTLVNQNSSSTIALLLARFSSSGAYGDVEGYVAGYIGELYWGRTWSIGKFQGGVLTELQRGNDAAGKYSIQDSIHERHVRFEVTDAVKRLYVDDILVAETTDNSITQVGQAGASNGQYTDSGILSITATGEGEPEPETFDPEDLTVTQVGADVLLEWPAPEMVGATHVDVFRKAGTDMTPHVPGGGA